MRIQRLAEGVHQFQKEIFKLEESFFQNLAHGQSPEVLFITCADSRVNPNLVTQTAPGELFLVRNVGNLVPVYTSVIGAEAAAIEFAVQQLRVKDIIVCGHTFCGAMQALLGEGPKAAPLPAMEAWLRHADPTRDIIRRNYAHLSGEELWRATIKENVLVQLEQLRTHPAVDAALREGRLHLHGWVYHLEDGGVAAYDPETAQFRAFGETVAAPGEPLLGP
jgi:carbonic anhydrase